MLQAHQPFEPLTVTHREHYQGQFIFTVKNRVGDLHHLPLQTLEYYPCIGDVVVVVAKPYCDWLVHQLQQLNGIETPAARRQRWRLEDELKDFRWMANEFVLQQLKEQDIAVIQASNIRRKLPLSCLRVLHKTRQRTSSLGKVA